ncbi:MAG: alpha/beta hydrolase [Lachnospiraceae bacterium]|nr:alpha/beta hydrolase [Lachnospiraceae bacterium]
MAVEKKSVGNLGFTMNYFTFGEGDKTFVILPGLSIKPVSDMAKMVADGYSVLHKDFTAYVFDRRSDIPEDYSVFDMARDTAAAIAELGLRDIYLFGASQGGMIALLITLEHPELVKKLALGSTTAHTCEENSKVIKNWIDIAKTKDGVALYTAFGKAIYPPKTYQEFEGALRLVGSTVTDDEIDRFVTMASAVKDFDVRESLKDIKCPVLVLAPEPDEVLGSDTVDDFRAVFAGREDYRERIYEGYGHAAFDTAPNYKEEILDFFLNTSV